MYKWQNTNTIGKNINTSLSNCISSLRITKKTTTTCNDALSKNIRPRLFYASIINRILLGSWIGRSSNSTLDDLGVFLSFGLALSWTRVSPHNALIDGHNINQATNIINTYETTKTLMMYTWYFKLPANLLGIQRPKLDSNNLEGTFGISVSFAKHVQL